MYIWIAVIAGIKGINVVMGFVVLKKLPAVHSVLNNATGGGLFLLPLSFLIVEPKYSAVLVCIMATCAAIQEGYYIRMGKEIPGAGDRTVLQKTRDIALRLAWVNRISTILMRF